MEKCEKKRLPQVIQKLHVKDMIKSAKEKGIIKSHTEAFEKNPVQQEKRK